MSDWFSETTNRLTERLARLEATAREYEYLMRLLSVVVERDMRTDSILITVTKADQVRHQTWNEILRAARMEPNENKG